MYGKKTQSHRGATPPTTLRKTRDEGRKAVSIKIEGIHTIAKC